MKPTWMIALIFVLALAACATTEGYEAVLQTWVGKSEGRLVEKWGPPRSVYKQPDGGRILTYERSRTVNVPGTVKGVRP